MANTSGEAIVLAPGRVARWRKLAWEAQKYRRLSTGLGVLLIMIIMTFSAGLWIQYDPTKADFGSTLLAPSKEHWFGTDRLGRDVFTRVIYGARISLFIGLAAVAWSAITGTIIGILAGYFRGKVDTILMRYVDAQMAFPSLILAMVLAFALGPSLINIAIALAITRGPSFARIIRSQVLAIRERDYILAATALGVPNWLIMYRHIFPHVTTLLAVNASLVAAGMIFAESSLAFLGLGVPPPTPTWGAMLRAGVPDLELAPWVSLTPGAAVTLAVLGFNFMGDGMRDLLDPQIRNIRKA